MKVGVIQSSFIPWRGYFDFIASVDVFVFHDDIQYTKGDWRNRNKIKTPKGTNWITVPVSYKCVTQLICETPIDYSTAWQKKHLRILDENYRTAPHFDVVMELLSGYDTEKNYSISSLNISLIRKICTYLNISTPMLMSNELYLEGKKTDRLIDLLTKLKAKTYLSGPSAGSYLDHNAFRQHGIGLEYKSYDYEPYPQQWGGFDGAVTVLDLIANCGHNSVRFLRSCTPDKLVD